MMSMTNDVVWLDKMNGVFLSLMIHSHLAYAASQLYFLLA